MDEEDYQGSYAPRSPDLSGFDPAPAINLNYPPSHPQHPYAPNPDSHQQFDPFAPEQPIYPPLPVAPRGRRAKAPYADDEFRPDQRQPKPGRPPKKQKIEEEVCNEPAPGEIEGVEVKTRFPTARIKRIIQKDEEIGKVGQVVPGSMSKALELFIISITLEATKVARSKSSRRITAQHLKSAVLGSKQLDFLEEIVSQVPSAPTSKAEDKRKGGATEDEESSDGAFVEPKAAKRKGPAPKKKRDRGVEKD